MTEGLRARKKQRTRAAIAEAAAALFAARGFDAVTTAEIAAAADVAAGTVFNYFPTKEELFFDRSDELAAALIDTVTGRPAGESVAEAFRRWHDREIAFLLDPRGAEATRRFFRTIEASPALRDAERRLHQRLEYALAAALRSLAPAGDPMPEILAAVLLSLHGVVLAVVRGQTLEGTPPGRLRAQASRTSARAYATLARAAWDWGRSEALPVDDGGKLSDPAG